MALHDQSYAPWSGRRTGRWPRIWALVRPGLRAPFKNIWILLVVIGAFAIVCAWLLFLLSVATQLDRFPQVERLSEMLFAVGNNIYRVNFFNTPFFSIILVLLAVAVGSALISRDLKHNALVTILSRAITPADYIAARYLTLVLFLMFVTLGPALLLWGGQIAMGTDALTTGQRLEDLGSIAVHSVILTVPLSAGVLACSALTKRAYVAGILWSAVHFAGEGFSALLGRLLREPWCGLLSWSRLTAHLADHVYAVREHRGQLVRPPDPALETGWLSPFLVLAAVTAASFALVRWRLRATEADE